MGAHAIAPAIVKEWTYHVTRCARCAAPPPSPLTVVPSWRLDSVAAPCGAFQPVGVDGSGAVHLRGGPKLP